MQIKHTQGDAELVLVVVALAVPIGGVQQHAVGALGHRAHPHLLRADDVRILEPNRERATPVSIMSVSVVLVDKRAIFVCGDIQRKSKKKRYHTRYNRLHMPIMSVVIVEGACINQLAVRTCGVQWRAGSAARGCLMSTPPTARAGHSSATVSEKYINKMEKAIKRKASPTQNMKKRKY